MKPQSIITRLCSSLSSSFLLSFSSLFLVLELELYYFGSVSLLPSAVFTAVKGSCTLPVQRRRTLEIHNMSTLCVLLVELPPNLLLVWIKDKAMESQLQVKKTQLLSLFFSVLVTTRLETLVHKLKSLLHPPSPTAVDYHLWMWCVSHCNFPLPDVTKRLINCIFVVFVTFLCQHGS